MVTKSTEPETFSAFSESHCLTQGSLADAALAARRYLDQNPARRALILRDSTCRLVDLDLSGDEDLLVRKAEHFVVPPSATTGLGSATSQEITLLPRHWEWLSTQGSSPSAVLRKLIDQARHDPQQQVDDLIRQYAEDFPDALGPGVEMAPPAEAAPLRGAGGTGRDGRGGQGQEATLAQVARDIPISWQDTSTDRSCQDNGILRALERMAVTRGPPKAKRERERE